MNTEPGAEIVRIPERRFISLVASFINFHLQLIDLKQIKKIVWRMAF